MKSLPVKVGEISLSLEITEIKTAIIETVTPVI